MNKQIKEQKLNHNKILSKPILKWAGGKKQLLKTLMPKVPERYNTYIEPFLGGGALFFALQPEKSIIADSNPELINLYRQVSENCNEVIKHLGKYTNTQEMFYQVRSQDWQALDPSEAAARMIYLNKTCFNGLYRVNRRGQFNVPFGKYKNPNICDIEALQSASKILKKAKIICGDYLLVLENYAKREDFVYLDPPYLPISKYSDFKRYTSEQFYENDHIELSKEVERLHQRGCFVLLTNSNHPLVHELYKTYQIEVVETNRHISCVGTGRKSEDVVITINPAAKTPFPDEPVKLASQVKKYPTTRFMGSKRKLLQQIWSIAAQFNFNTVVDLFSGSGVVGYMFKAQGKRVICNDHMAMSAVFSLAMVENSFEKLLYEEANNLLNPNDRTDNFVSETFQGLYYTDAENILIDTIRANISEIKDKYKQAIAMSALIRACTKKRPRGVFTYVGDRYNDGRKDLQKSLTQQFLEAVDVINNSIFDNGRTNVSILGDAMELEVENPELIYIDPPYYSPYSDNEYVRRYHFVEGLARDWKGVEIQQHTQTKKFKSYTTPFSTRDGTAGAFDKLFHKFSESILLVSYSSNSLPSKDEMLSLISKYKNNVHVVPIEHTYSFGNQNAKINNNKNKAEEYLFVGF